MISKDDNFKVTKTYTTEKPSLGVYTKNDDFLTPTWHGRYVKVRANYGYGVHGKWSEKKMIGCGNYIYIRISSMVLLTIKIMTFPDQFKCMVRKN